VRKLWTLSVAAQIGLLALIAGIDGLSATGWIVGVASVLTTNALFHRALSRSGTAKWGPANAVTMARAGIVAGVAALVTTGFNRPTPVATLVSLAAIALVLDGVDGWVARRRSAVTRVGARFDMEVDAFLILALSVYVALSLSLWVLAIGAMRYLFLAAGRLLPWMRDPLPPRYWRKVVAAVQGVTLTVAASGLVSRAWTETMLLCVLALTLESFGRDIRWLTTRHFVPTSVGVSSRLRTASGFAVTLGCVVLLWAALVAPAHVGELTASAFLRIPVEGLVLMGVALVLRPWPRHLLAVVVGIALAGITVLKALDIGFSAVLDRPFNPATDWSNLGPAIGVLAASSGVSKTTLRVAVAVLIAAVLGALIAAALRVTNRAARHRSAAYKFIAGLGSIAVLCAALGVTSGPGLPVAATSSAGLVAEQVRLLRAGLQASHTFTARLTSADRFAITPGSHLLTGLRGKDVLLVFVESYGRVAVQGSTFSPQVDRVLNQGTAELRAAGWSSRSAFLTSPTFGGVSWLAHSTLQSGLWVDSPQRYTQLEASGRFTLSEAFKRAGWRTVFDIPSSPSPWPQGEHLYHFDKMYGTKDVGYVGPSFGYPKIPDQYTLAALYQRELASAPHKPVMAEVDLVSSHIPWAPLPRMVPWDSLGNGAIYDPMPAEGHPPSYNPAQERVAYGQSIQYSLTALISFLQTFHDNNLVLVVLGDHQPATFVSGENASHDVPVTVIAHDASVIDRIKSWGWDDGLLPSPHAPVWRMDTFRNRFLSAYGPLPFSTVRTVTSKPDRSS